MNNKINNTSKNSLRLLTKPASQNGMAVLGMVALLLVVVGLLSITASKSTILETKMVFNLQDKQRSSLAADSAALYAWEQAQANLDTKVIEIIKNDNQPGYYVLGDKITIDGSSKSSIDWDANENVTAWPWDDSNKRFELPQQIGGIANPMKLQANPQYTLGMHNPVLRKGTAGYKCIPVSIIGASKGGTDTTRTLIELNAIPKSGCYYDKIK